VTCAWAVPARRAKASESLPHSHCHSPNFCIAGSDDIRAVIDSRQRCNCASASYVAVRDAICHAQFTGQLASKAKSSGRSDMSWSPRSRESMSPFDPNVTVTNVRCRATLLRL
jgi:hypothetical protein